MELLSKSKADATGDYDHYMKVLLSEYVVTIDQHLGMKL